MKSPPRGQAIGRAGAAVLLLVAHTVRGALSAGAPGEIVRLISCQVPSRNLNLTDELHSFVLAHVESGRYANASEVVRAALRSPEREEREYDVKLAALRALIDEGDASGVAAANRFERVRAAVVGKRRKGSALVAGDCGSLFGPC